jgi:arylsulfatase A-like enzyme
MPRHLLLSLLAVLVPLPALAAERKPSFVVIVTDDQRADCLGVAGHPLLKTPNIDRLAKEGTRFPNMFVTTSICCVSRASLMTGQLCRHHGVGDFSTPLPPENLAITYPALLKAAGYRTGCVGKWGIGGKEPRDVFDFWDAWGGQGNFFHMVGTERVHNSEYLARKADEFLAGCKADQPFCLVLLYKSPHDPYQPDPRDADLFKDADIPRPKTYTDEYFHRLPEFLQKSEARTRHDKWIPKPEAYPEFVKQYLRCIAGVDRSVGKVLGTLEKAGRLDDTVIVYTSDNGFHLGEHGLIEKWFAYEESIRVPLIVRDPAVPRDARGQVREELVLNIDVAPTILSRAGVAIPKAMDGVSLLPLVRGEKPAWRQDFFYEHHFNYGGKIPQVEAIRTTDWKYIVYPASKPVVEELYDLKNDPREETNRIDDPKAAAMRDALRKRYREVVDKLPPPVLPR